VEVHRVEQCAHCQAPLEEVNEEIQINEVVRWDSTAAYGV
jgi:hypothetical protein